MDVKDQDSEINISGGDPLAFAKMDKFYYKVTVK